MLKINFGKRISVAVCVQSLFWPLFYPLVTFCRSKCALVKCYLELYVFSGRWIWIPDAIFIQPLFWLLCLKFMINRTGKVLSRIISILLGWIRTSDQNFCLNFFSSQGSFVASNSVWVFQKLGSVKDNIEFYLCHVIWAPTLNWVYVCVRAVFGSKSIYLYLQGRIRS